MENTENTGFSYTYNAKQQAEIQNIRSKYITPEESKLDQLRRLDKSASAKATKIALTLGILGALILGCGMSLIMTTLGEFFALDKNASLLWGIPIGLVGIVLVCLAYPLYNQVLKRTQKRLAPQILQLTDELLK